MAAPANTWRLLASALAMIAMLAVTPLLRFYAHNIHESLDPAELTRYAAAWSCGVAWLAATSQSDAATTPCDICAR